MVEGPDAAVEGKFAAAVAEAVIAKLGHAEPMTTVVGLEAVKPPSQAPLILKYAGAALLCLSGFLLVMAGKIEGMAYISTVVVPTLSALGIHSALTSRIAATPASQPNQ